MADVSEREQADNLKLRRAELARQVLENSVYNESLMVVRATCIEIIEKTKPSDVEAIQDATRTLQNLNRLEKTLKRVYETGKTAEKKRRLFGNS